MSCNVSGFELLVLNHLVACKQFDAHRLYLVRFSTLYLLFVSKDIVPRL
jgi:hypothetical protein